MGKNRIWLNGDDGASYNIGCRTGGEQLDAIVLNAASITANGTPLSLFTPVDPGVAAVGITDAVTTVKSLLPHASGFDATQLQSVLPGAFSTNEVVTDADANTTETVTSYDQTKLIPLLTKALQEALTRIEELRATPCNRCIQRLLIYRMLLIITVRLLTFTMKVLFTSLTLVTGSSFKTHKIVVT